MDRQGSQHSLYSSAIASLTRPGRPLATMTPISIVAGGAMASVMAIVSKAVFETQHGGARLGMRLGMDRYVSPSKVLRALGDGGVLVLVTVRPGDRLWACAILE